MAPMSFFDIILAASRIESFSPMHSADCVMISLAVLAIRCLLA
jgi:hypothetical protein